MSLTGLPLLRVMGLQLTTGSGRKRPKLMDFPGKSQRPPPRVRRRYLLPVLERGPKKFLNLSQFFLHELLRRLVRLLLGLRLRLHLRLRLRLRLCLLLPLSQS